MTLILSRTSAQYVLQVTDRLVSVGNTPFAKTANKNVLIFAKDAVVCLAYTGWAYLQGIPTDQWIAQKLVGANVDGEKPKAFHALTTDLAWRDIGHSLLYLTEELTTRRQNQYFNLFIPLVGWQWNSKGLLRPFSALIGPLVKKRAFGIRYDPRYRFGSKEVRTTASPIGHITRKELEDLSSRLIGTPASDAEDILVDKIREVSLRSSVVGPHCMSILLPPLSDPTITVRYLMAKPPESSGAHELADNDKIWGYSPWIVCPKGFWPPQRIVGGVNYKVGPFTVRYESNADKNPRYLFYMQGQKRALPP